MAAAPVPLGGPPQWALDQHNVLRHDIFWNNEIMLVMHYNTQLTIRQQQVLASWAAARGLNASCDRDFEPLQALPMPLALIPVPVAPAPPAPGAALVLPAPFVAPPVALPPPHILFPANKGALRGLTRPQLSTLLLAYNEPVPAATAARRAAVARLVGVRL
ncbi:hypothetical protein B0H14DRAFT_3472159 [Mycena olivaceomarginata]|nr:hypothetical protein B0H14DRAFT_3472159 [Mycena olivaceomarginata]